MTNSTLPWQHDLQLNLETWKKVAEDNNLSQIVLTKKPLKLNVDYLQEYVEKAKIILKTRSQHDLSVNSTNSS